jgi:hypothetical protein
MSNWARMRHKATKHIGEGLEESREYLDELRRETAPQRKRLGREAKRQAPKVAAFALATISELMRNYGRRPSQRPRRRALKVLLSVALFSWFVFRVLKPRKS